MTLIPYFINLPTLLPFHMQHKRITFQPNEIECTKINLDDGCNIENNNKRKKM